MRYRQASRSSGWVCPTTPELVLGPRVHDFLNTRCLTIAGGSEQILLTLAGERLLGLPR